MSAVESWFDAPFALLRPIVFTALSLGALCLVLAKLREQWRGPRRWRNMLRFWFPHRPILIVGGSVGLLALIGWLINWLADDLTKYTLVYFVPRYLWMAAVVTFFVVVSLLPVITFLLLFTTFGNTWLRWRKKLPARERFRFGMPSLLIGFTLAAVAMSGLRMLEPHFELWMICGVWIVMSVPLTILMAIMRYMLDVWEERCFQRKLAAKKQAAPIQITVNETPPDEAFESRWSLRHSEERQHHFGGVKVSIRGSQAYGGL